jgi:hypothetical protein
VGVGCSQKGILRLGEDHNISWTKCPPAPLQRHAARFTAGRFSFYDGGVANKRQERDRLAQSDHHIAELKQSIHEQLDLIDELKRAGRDAAEDEELLDALLCRRDGGDQKKERSGLQSACDELIDKGAFITGE